MQPQAYGSVALPSPAAPAAQPASPQVWAQPAAQGAASPAPPTVESGPLGFLLFKRFITPTLLVGLFWLMIVGGELFCVYQIFDRPSHIGETLLVMFLGPIALRLYAELLIVLFRVQETLVEVRDRLPR